MFILFPHFYIYRKDYIAVQSAKKHVFTLRINAFMDRSHTVWKWFLLYRFWIYFVDFALTQLLVSIVLFYCSFI